jgi:DNA-binding MarR family transcriptional regulator
MLKSGLILKKKHPERKNWVRIVLTDKGREALKISLELKAVINILTALSPQERDQLKALLKKISLAATQELTQMETVSLPVFP